MSAEVPTLPPCPTDSREWHLTPGAPAVNDAGQSIEALASGVTGTAYSNTLYCRKHRTFVNPKGNTCAACARGRWPMKERSGRRDLRGCKPCNDRLLAGQKAMMRQAEAPKKGNP